MSRHRAAAGGLRLQRPMRHRPPAGRPDVDRRGAWQPGAMAESSGTIESELKGHKC